MSTANSTDRSVTYTIAVGIGAADGGIEVLEAFFWL